MNGVTVADLTVGIRTKNFVLNLYYKNTEEQRFLIKNV